MKAKYGEDGHDNIVRQSVQPPEKDIQYYKLLDAITSAETTESLDVSKGDVIDALKNRSITQFQRENLERIIKSNQLKIKNAPPKVETNAQSDLFEKTFAQYSKGRLGDSSVDRIATMFESGEITPEQYTKLADLLKSRCESLWNQSPSDAQEWFDETLQKRNAKIARKKAAEAAQTTPEQQKEKTDQALAEAQRQVKEAEEKAAEEEQAKKEAEQRAAEAEIARQTEETARKEAEKRAQEAEKQLEKSSGHEAVPIDKNVIQGYNNGSQNDGAATSKTSGIPQKATQEQEENFKALVNSLSRRRVDFNSKADSLKEALEHGWLTQSQADDFAGLLKAKYAETKGVSAEEAQKWYDVARLGEAEIQRRREEDQKKAKEAERIAAEEAKKMSASRLRGDNPVLTTEEFFKRYDHEENKPIVERYKQSMAELAEQKQKETDEIERTLSDFDKRQAAFKKLNNKFENLEYEASKEHVELVHKIMFPVDVPESNNRVALRNKVINVFGTKEEEEQARQAMDFFGRMMDNLGVDITVGLDDVEMNINRGSESDYSSRDKKLRVKKTKNSNRDIQPLLIHELFHMIEHRSDKAAKITNNGQEFWKRVVKHDRSGNIRWNRFEQGIKVADFKIPMPNSFDGHYARRTYEDTIDKNKHHEFTQVMMEYIARGKTDTIRRYPEWFDGVMNIFSPDNL